MGPVIFEHPWNELKNFGFPVDALFIIGNMYPRFPFIPTKLDCGFAKPNDIAAVLPELYPVARPDNFAV
jgi:hypothetical protein